MFVYFFILVCCHILSYFHVKILTLRHVCSGPTRECGCEYDHAERGHHHKARKGHLTGTNNHAMHVYVYFVLIMHVVRMCLKRTRKHERGDHATRIGYFLGICHHGHLTACLLYTGAFLSIYRHVCLLYIRAFVSRICHQSGSSMCIFAIHTSFSRHMPLR